MKVLKKIGSITVDILIILVFVVSVILVIANMASDKENGGQANVFGYVINSVQSDSMSGTFEKGALVIGKIPDKDTKIVVGESIITFEQKQGDVIFQNTHRVVAEDKVGTVTYYQTQGDNRKVCPEPDADWKSMGDIQAVYVTHIPLLGGFIDFLKEPLGFVLLLVLPMLAFIGFQIYKLVSIYMKAKKEEMIEEAKSGVSDEAKDAIIKEYLAKMQAEQAAKQAEEVPADKSDETDTE